MILRALFFALFCGGLASSVPAAEERDAAEAPTPRWLPDACALVEVEDSAGGVLDRASVDGIWNETYRQAMAALGDDDLDTTERLLCRALRAVRDVPATDVRFAETLDELGRVGYLRGDFAYAEAMQGAAVVEMLLATGPPTRDLTEESAGSCHSSVAVYMMRLGWIFEQQGRTGEIDALMAAPHLALMRGYLPAATLAPRLDALIGQYLLREAYDAADGLTALKRSMTAP